MVMRRSQISYSLKDYPICDKERVLCYSGPMKTIAVRGAITVENDPDEAKAMIQAVGTLARSLMKSNSITIESIVSVQFSQTADLQKMNAASALRIALPDFDSVPLFCSQEPEVEGSLPRAVRILIIWRGRGPALPLYLNEASSLRPDLLEKQ